MDGSINWFMTLFRADLKYHTILCQTPKVSKQPSFNMVGMLLIFLLHPNCFSTVYICPHCSINMIRWWIVWLLLYQCWNVAIFHYIYHIMTMIHWKRILLAMLLFLFLEWISYLEIVNEVYWIMTTMTLLSTLCTPLVCGIFYTLLLLFNDSVE